MAKLLAYPVLDAARENLLGVRMLVREENCIHYITHRFNDCRTLLQKVDDIKSADADAIEHEFRLDIKYVRKNLPKAFTWKRLLTEYKKFLESPTRCMTEI